MKHNIGVVINFCTYDAHLIDHSIREARRFASQVIVTYTDHFYTGQPENLPLIKKIIKRHSRVKFVKIKYHKVNPPIPEFLCKLIPRSTNLRPLYGPHYWSCMSKTIACQHINKKPDYLLFLDSDEVVDGKRFKKWLDTGNYRKYEAIHFACYFYFRSPKNQAITYEGCGLLTKNGAFKKTDFLSHYDRWNILRRVKGKKTRFVLGTDNKPLIHHYAWARNKENMLEKVSTWGHSQERDWQKMVKDEFKHPFNGTDFLRRYSYKKVKPFIAF